MPLIIQGVRAILREAPAVAKRYQNAIRFSRSRRRHVEAEFTSSEVPDKGGAMLLAEADYRMGLTQAAAEAVGNERRVALNATDLARTSPQTIRLTLVKVGAVVISTPAGSPNPSPRRTPENLGALSLAH